MATFFEARIVNKHGHIPAKPLQLHPDQSYESFIPLGKKKIRIAIIPERGKIGVERDPDINIDLSFRFGARTSLEMYPNGKQDKTSEFRFLTMFPGEEAIITVGTRRRDGKLKTRHPVIRKILITAREALQAISES